MVQTQHAPAPEDAPAPEPVVPAPLPERFTDATAGCTGGAVFTALSAARRHRFLHPYGEAYQATLVIDGDDQAGFGVPLLDDDARYDAIVRLSRGVGLPEGWPDIRGLALRVLDAHGPGQDQDLLLASSAGRAVLRHLLVPAGGYEHALYSSLLPYRVGARTCMFGARAEGPGQYELMLASPTGDWEHVGTVELGERLDDEEAEALEFNPYVTGGGIEPMGMLQSVRRRVYQGSQRGRRATG